MRNSIAYLMIFRNHVRFFVRNQIAARDVPPQVDHAEGMRSRSLWGCNPSRAR